VGDIVEQVRREVSVEPLAKYSLLGVRWYGEGLFIRETKPGAEVAAAKLYRIEKGDFVYNRLFAWKGSFGIAGPEVHGCHVSGEFQTFRVDPSQIDVRYLMAQFRDPAAWGRVEDRSTGGTPTSRNRLKEAAFLELRVLVPSLDEQRRVVNGVERVLEAADMRRRNLSLVEALAPSAINHAFAGLL